MEIKMKNKEIRTKNNHNYYIIILILLCITLSNTTLLSSELGVKYLKLANSYRELNDFKKSEMYLQKGLSLVEKNSYWEAYGYESLGYLNRDLYINSSKDDNKDNYKKLSIEYFEKSLNIYKNIIKMKDGSTDVIKEQINNIKNNKISLNNQNKEMNNTLNFDNQKLKDLTDLPTNIENLSAINNKFKQIPQNIVNLKSLKYLNLEGNNIKMIPDFISELNKLEYINLSNNKIKDISNYVVNLENLKILDLSNNKIKKLPLSICQLKKLEILNLSGNNIAFSEIKNLIICLKNTNIIFDEFDNSPTGLDSNLDVESIQEEE